MDTSYRKKQFTNVTEAIRYTRSRPIERHNIVYIATKHGRCELAYRSSQEKRYHAY